MHKGSQCGSESHLYRQTSPMPTAAREPRPNILREPLLMFRNFAGSANHTTHTVNLVGWCGSHNRPAVAVGSPEEPAVLPHLLYLLQQFFSVLALSCRTAAR